MTDLSKYPDVLTVEQVAVILGCHKNTVRNYIRKKLLPAFPAGSGNKNKHWRVQKTVLEAYLKAHPPVEEDVLSLVDVAYRLGCHVNTVKNLIKLGKLAPTQGGVKRAELMLYIKKWTGGKGV